LFFLLFKFSPNCLLKTALYRLPITSGGLAAGGGMGAVWTRTKDDVTCTVSYETAPPLAPNRLLAAVLSLFIACFQNRLYIHNSSNSNQSLKVQQV
jgi:hypothetical protein